ncbi:carbohydrate porin [Klebsiella pneumoniae]|nr:carbohydrate porin [Klebsiella pneumoniae]
MIKLKHSIPLAFLSLAGAGQPGSRRSEGMIPAPYGYIRSGSSANPDGNCVDSVGLMPDGKWRLGNEEDTKIELIPTVTPHGGQRRCEAGQPHSPVEMHSSDWNCHTTMASGRVQFREGFAELEQSGFCAGDDLLGCKRE